MCGGGTGSANDSSNDNESGSGNSFKETLANIFTPGDGLKYVDGQLTATNAQSSYKPPVSGNDNSGVTNVQVYGQDGNAFNIPSNQTQMSNTRIGSALFGAATGGIPGLIGNLAMNELTKGKAMQGIMGSGSEAVNSVKGLFKTNEPKSMKDVRPRGPLDSQRERQALMAQMDSNNDIYPDVGNGSTVAAPTVTVNSGIDAPSAMSAAAGGGGFQPVPNPNYDPSDPMSPQFLSNPTYAQLLSYRDSQQVPGMAMGGFAQIGMGFPGGPPMQRAAGPYGQTGSLMDQNPLQQYGGYLEQQYGDAGFDQKKDQFLQEVLQKEQQTFSGSGGFSDRLPAMNSGPEYLTQRQTSLPAWMQGAAGPMRAESFAEGGELTAGPPEGGNEKTMISDAVIAVKGEMSEEQSAVVLGQFLANYGEEALRDLVDKVQSGEFDDTVDRFANGEAGEVRGPGDGSGVDDKVPASLEGQQDVLLADGEFVLRKKTADALEKKYGGGFLDAVNKAESAAPKTMQQYMARN